MRLEPLPRGLPKNFIISMHACQGFFQENQGFLPFFFPFCSSHSQGKIPCPAIIRRGAAPWPCGASLPCLPGKINIERAEAKRHFFHALLPTRFHRLSIKSEKHPLVPQCGCTSHENIPKNTPSQAFSSAQREKICSIFFLIFAVAAEKKAKKSFLKTANQQKKLISFFRKSKQVPDKKSYDSRAYAVSAA